ncbi:hypothetical protein OHA84_21080 [Streptomyces sp. NBC_00513]|nr:hypothetical protein [Streptomyces sp. NBC_00424]WUD42800.1 hypothetical protein OHA84_21080 [Streptomyces sp. NBC_00513]
MLFSASIIASGGFLGGLRQGLEGAGAGEDVGHDVRRAGRYAVDVLGALVGRAQVEDGLHAQPAELGEVVVGELGQGVGAVDLAHLDPPAVGGAVAAGVAEVGRSLQSHEAVGEAQALAALRLEVEPLAVGGGQSRDHGPASGAALGDDLAVRPDLDAFGAAGVPPEGERTVGAGGDRGLGEGDGGTALVPAVPGGFPARGGRGGGRDQGGGEGGGDDGRGEECLLHVVEAVGPRTTPGERGMAENNRVRGQWQNVPRLSHPARSCPEPFIFRPFSGHLWAA